MVYRRRRKYVKRKSYRRPAYRKRKMMGRRSRADKGHLEKLTIRGELQVDAGGAFAQHITNWCATGATGANETFFTGGGGNVNNQFAQCAGMYREYYVSSLKIEYRPTHFEAGNAPGFVLKTIMCGTSMDRLSIYPVADTEFRAALDSKVYDVNKPFKRFYRVSKYAKQKMLQWRSCTDAVTGANGGFHALPNCQTVMQCVVANLAAGETVGEVFVTYYIRFHHRVRA